ncbi:MAG TPA: hypothetical protein VLF79_01645 [Candidatus Saccharimonadales bacterium]|nr:hypothetical protein [Candidatus Saccharimonadales bacterium]
MSNKKNELSKEEAELKELEHRVDAMMSTELPDDKSSKTITAAVGSSSSLRVISDYAHTPQKSAPKLTTKPEKRDKKVSESKTQPTEETETEVKNESESADEPIKIKTAKTIIDIPEPTESKPSKSIIDDPETDKAVSDIVAHEGDTQLAVDDAVAKQKSEASASAKPGLVKRFFTSILTWLFFIMALIVVFLWVR